MSSQGWSRVAAGLAMVAEAAIARQQQQAVAGALRVTRHGAEALSSIQSVYSNQREPSTNHYSDFMQESPEQQPTTASTAAAIRTIQAPANNIAVSNFDQTQKHAIVDETSGLAPENTIKSSREIYEKSASHDDMSSSSTSSPVKTALSDANGDLPRLKEGRPVPSTRVGRAFGFASLGLGLAFGTAVEGVSRLFSPSKSTSLVVTDSNADRLASTLCRMRGAALKLGQMLSIQDESLLPPELVRALNQVRQGADAMPKYQLHKQLISQLGKDWRDKFVEFNEMPFAAASIGQVHRASIRRANGTIMDVVVKVQYPGVARSIESDLRNLAMLVSWTGMAPPGLFLDNVIRVGTAELKSECDYRTEMKNQKRILQLVADDPILRHNSFVVPDVVEDLTSSEVLTTRYAPGGTIDKVVTCTQEERNRIARTILYLTMKELFEWRFMQTDPNWGNFLYDMGSQTTTLIDFGATREYAKDFVDGYLRIVWASANRDEETLMAQSRRMKFLTGEENDAMLHAHKMSGYTVGEPFWSHEPFDFRGSNISTRMGEHTSVFLKHRLTPPPEEVYTLHRKLAGAYMLCIKLGAVIPCRDLLEDVLSKHVFEDGMEHPR